MKRALLIDPDYQECRNFMKDKLLKSERLKKSADDLYKAKKYKDAIKIYENCLKINKNNDEYNAKISMNTALAYMQLDN